MVGRRAHEIGVPWHWEASPSTIEKMIVSWGAKSGRRPTAGRAAEIAVHIAEPGFRTDSRSDQLFVLLL